MIDNINNDYLDTVDQHCGIAIFLCDLTGVMAEPWLEAGYDCWLIDPQHGEDFHKGRLHKLAATIEQAKDKIGSLVRTGRVVFVAGFPPCTDVAVSGARWFEEKRAKDRHFQAKAAIVAEQCRVIGWLSGAPWMFENPVSVFSSIFGRPDHTFHPWHFTGFEPHDNYTKQTCLWTGGGFVMPDMLADGSLGEPDNRIHSCPPSEERANIRSATPRGFAKAVFQANAPHLKFLRSLRSETKLDDQADLFEEMA